MSDKVYYATINRKMIVKALEELSFEEVLHFEHLGDSYDQDRYQLICPNCSYQFKARIGAWGNFQIEVNSLEKIDHESSELKVSAFFRDVQKLCEISDEILAPYIEEAHQTIASEMLSLKTLSKVDLKELCHSSFTVIDQMLLSHPKIIMNKGRLGWGNEDFKKYAPESQPEFQLIWLAIKKNRVQTGVESKEALEKLYHNFFTEKQMLLLAKLVPEKSLQSYDLMPVHPWQWDHYIKHQFSELIVSGEMRSLGATGPLFTPLSSLRTLSMPANARVDIKLPVSILNTSCVRGLPGKFIRSGYEISNGLDSLINSDDFLKDKVEILKEFCAQRVEHPDYDLIKSSSYRYHELLASVFRESVDSKLKPNEAAIPTAALLYQDLDKPKHSFVYQLVSESGQRVEEWLKSYFECVILPLYHLQIVYGVGLVAHGQNTILVHNNGVPKRLIIKDFHGDLRLSEESILKDQSGFKFLDKLPANYLIHDLFTGHFITVLRYLSRVVYENFSYKEKDFYSLLGSIIKNYEDSPELPRELSEANRKKNLQQMSLLKPSFEKLLVNKVRFVAGYSETAQRLKPMLGKDYINPLVQ